MTDLLIAWAVFTEQELNPVYVEISELLLWLWTIFRSRIVPVRVSVSVRH